MKQIRNTQPTNIVSAQTHFSIRPNAFQQLFRSTFKWKNFVFHPFEKISLIDRFQYSFVFTY